MTFGLSSETLARIRDVFASNVKIQRVRVFGSRALGRHREGSDIDLAVEGVALELDDLLAIRVGLEELGLPYRFDVVDLGRLEASELREHIERAGGVIFERGR